MYRLTACVLLLTITAAWAGDWPQWLGPRRDGGSAESVSPWKSAPKVLWRKAVGNAYSSPVVAGGRVFVHSAVAGKEEEIVQAFDAVTGKPLWSDTYKRPAYNSVLGRGPRATPTVAGGKLFTIGINGVLSGYDAEKGKRLWQVDLYKELEATLPRFGVCSSPL